MVNITFEEFEKAVETLELIGLENRNRIKKKYLKLSKEHHPDMANGSVEKFQEINRAYNILNTYIDNYKFNFTKEEFKNQYGGLSDGADWFYG